jgi:hypothetical protein
LIFSNNFFIFYQLHHEALKHCSIIDCITFFEIKGTPSC